ncbi:MAG: hypothetical protein MUF81_06410 [Verrucomicrobia bacterium]|nr:hypothetical protein [Verrucomicrobiota bacterium]
MNTDERQFVPARLAGKKQFLPVISFLLLALQVFCTDWQRFIPLYGTNNRPSNGETDKLVTHLTIN